MMHKQMIVTILAYLLVTGVIITGCATIHYRAVSNGSAFQYLTAADLKSRHLPESFVSVFVKNSDGTSSHLVGGFLVHPGVVLTTWGRDWQANSYGINQQGQMFPRQPSNKVYTNDELGIVFYKKSNHYNKSSFDQLHYSVSHIISHPNYRHYDQEEFFQTATLLFFTPDQRIAHIKPLPLATSNDLEYYDDLVDQQLWAVGVEETKSSDFNGLMFGDHRNPQCHDRAYSQLGKIDFAMTPREYNLLWNIIDRRQRKTTGEFQRNSISLWRCISSDKPDFFCAEAIASHSPRTGLSYQCPRHIGYPVLWQTTAGYFKVLGLTSSSPFFSKSYQSIPEEVKVKEGMYEQMLPDPPRSLQYNLIYLHSWLKSSLESYFSTHNQADFAFELNSPVLASLDNSITQPQDNVKHYEFIAKLGTALNNNGDLLTNCMGTMIQPGVILTAAHCLIDHLVAGSPDNPNQYAAFIKQQQEYLVKIDTIKIHPEYNSVFLSHQTHSTSPVDIALLPLQTDIALLFYEDHHELPQINPLPINTHPDILSRKFINLTGTMYQVASYAVAGMAPKRAIDRKYTTVPVKPISSRDQLVNYLVKGNSLDSVRAERLLSKAQVAITEPLKVKNTLFYLKKDISDFIQDQDLQFIDQSRIIAVLRPYKLSWAMEAKNALGMGGDSGSPLIYNDDSSLSLVGVYSGSQIITRREAQLRYGRHVAVASHLNWITQIIDDET